MFREFAAKYIANYETVKLDVFYPDHTNYLLILLFIVLIMVTSQKNEFNGRGGRLLDVSHTDQLKGIAIFFIVLGHLWVHVSKTRAQIVLSGDSVSLFLLLSGYGLVISIKGQLFGIKDFCLKRIKRVMLPYWLVTILIIILDYLILQRTLRFDSLLLTFLGINIKIANQHIDYVRWFITFILFWYSLFYIFYIKFKFNYSAILLLVIAFGMLPLDYYYLHFGWYQYFSFPVGCLLAAYYEEILIIYKNNKSKFLVLSTVGSVYVFAYKLMVSHQSIRIQLDELMPSILMAYISEWNSLIIVFSILVVTGWLIERGYSSKILLLLGKYSYEIFLLHGVFLIKYNPILMDQRAFLIVVQFSVFLLLITGISILTNKIHQKIYVNILQ